MEKTTKKLHTSALFIIIVLSNYQKLPEYGQNTYPPRRKQPLRTVQSICLAMVATLMLANCAKEETPEVATIEPDPIAEARSFFENKSKNTAVDTANALHRQQQSGELLWSEAKIREKGDSAIVFVPVKTSADYFAVDEGVEAGLYQLTAQLRAFSTDGKNWQLDMVTYVPEGNTGGGFTGTVLEEGWFGGQARYTRFYDGRILRNGRHPNGQINKLMGWIIDCYYQTIYGYVNGYLNAVYNRYVCEQVWHDDGPPMPEMYDPPMGGPPANNHDSNMTIRLDINDDLDEYPCAKALVAQLTMLDNGLAKLLDKIFGDSENFKINFESSDLLPDTVSGVESGYGVPIEHAPNGAPTYNSTIKLNSSMLENATKEYILATMYHEALHSFLRAQRSQLGHSAFNAKYPEITEYEYAYGNGKRTKKYKIEQNHTRFAVYVDALTDAIRSFNPNMPLASARAMAKMGIVEGSSLNNTEKLLNGNERDVSKGLSKGTKCP